MQLLRGAGDFNVLPWQDTNVLGRSGQEEVNWPCVHPGSGKLEKDWLEAKCSLCGDGMKCFQRNWLIVQDAKYLFDQTRLQLKKPKSLDFKSRQTWFGGNRQWGRAGESCLQSENCGKDVTAGHTLYGTWGREG